MSLGSVKIKKLLKNSICAVLLSMSFGLSAWSASVAVNVNSASAEQIAETLKGIGIKKARRIVEFRKSIGPITSTDQLMEVKGIGEKTVARNEGLIEF
ncbi:MAG: hypothetical protein COB04_01345 [Gammaproteobacteria bacterium]|nr:MAG: hypothetical protein COB04_01345 [Gammaproteobacteria bacterium]